MKRIFTLLVAVLLTASVFAQSPEKMSYQAVIRDADNELVKSQAVGMQISILQGTASGTAVYVETQTPTTNTNGLVTIEIGDGTTTEDFSAIDWANAIYFIKTETDPNGGNNYNIVGTSQLLSVPYALHAKTAGNTFSGSYSDLTEKPDLTNYVTEEVDADVTNELQALSISNDTIYLSNGGFVKLPNANSENGFSGSYDDLINKPVNIDEDSTDDFSGSYDDLTDKPDLSLKADKSDVYTKTDFSESGEAQIDYSNIANLPANLDTDASDDFNGSYNNLTDKPDFTNFLTQEADSDVTNELQALSISNDTIYLSNGGFIKLPSANSENGFSGSYDDLINKPDLTSKADKSDVYTKTEMQASGQAQIDYSNIANLPVNLDTDASDDFNGNYSALTGSPDLSLKADKSDVYTKTEMQASGQAQIDYSNIANLPVNLDTDASDDFNGNYNNLTGSPDLSLKADKSDVYTKTDLESSGLAQIDYSNIANLPVNLDTDASDDFDGSYNNLIDKPDLSLKVNATDVYTKLEIYNLEETNNLLGQKQDVTKMNTASGYAGLDIDGKILPEQLPESIMGGLDYAGTLEPVAGFAGLIGSSLPPADVSNKGQYYKISTTGDYDVEGVTVTLNAGDWLISNGEIWEKIQSVETITSVNGKIGTVELTTDDVPETATRKYFSATEKAKLEGIETGAKNYNIIADIDDATVLTDKIWSSDKINAELSTKTNNTDVYTKTDLQSSGQAQVNYSNITNLPVNLDTDASDDFSGSYNDLINNPDLTLKADKSDVYSKTDMQSSGQAQVNYSNITNLPANLDIDASDDFDANYNNLTNKPDLSLKADKSDVYTKTNFQTSGQAQVNYSNITNLPVNLDTDASDDFSGSYSDLTNKPDLTNIAANTTAITSNDTDIASNTTAIAENTSKIGIAKVLTKAERDALTNPTNGTFVFCTDLGGTGQGGLQIIINGTWLTLSGVATLVETTVVSDITRTTATCGGNITEGGGTSVTNRGICWSTTTNPTITDNTTTDGTGTGTFTSSITGLTAGITYYVRSYATNSEGTTTYGDEVTFTTESAILPTIETNAIGSIASTSATSGGNITDAGGVEITARGVCWSTTTSPIITDNTTTDSTGAGTFTSSITGLTPETAYYVRAYATNSVGTAYGEEVTFSSTESEPVGSSFTDVRDSKTYNTVNIGDQTWMVENLAYLPSVNTSGQTSETEARYYVYEYEGTDISTAKTEANYTTYGVLYNWTAAMDGAVSSDANPSGVQGVCPAGWHLPSNAELTELTTYLGGIDVAGDKLKATSGWYEDGGVGNGTNESGFTALPGGSFDFMFQYSEINSNWWSSTEGSTTNAAILDLWWNGSSIWNTVKTKGCYIRCVKN